MTTGMVSIENCPRDLDGILQIQRGIRYRLGIQTRMFKNDAEEQAFLGAPDQTQAEALLAHLQQFDAGAVQQAQPVQPPPTQIALPPQQQPAAPGAVAPPPQQAQMPVGPQMPTVVAPPAMPQQAVVAPPQAPPAAAPAAPPQVAMPAMPAAPAAPQAPVVQPPQTPPAAPVAQPPAASTKKSGKKPSTASDPTNAGTAVTPDPKTAQILQQLAKTVKEMAETHGGYLEEIHEQQAGMTRLLTVILSVQLAMAEQAGIDRAMLAKCIKAMGDDAPEDFLKNFEEEEEGKE